MCTSSDEFRKLFRVGEILQVFVGGLHVFASVRTRVLQFREFLAPGSFHRCAQVNYGAFTGLRKRVKEFREILALGSFHKCT